MHANKGINFNDCKSFNPFYKKKTYSVKNMQKYNDLKSQFLIKNAQK